MSNPRVTITLGRSGQVVERGGSVSDSMKMRGGDSRLVSGRKRSMGERLGNNAHGFSFSGSKRQHGDGIKWSGGDKQLNDSRISRNDLRLKLLRKRLSKQVVEEHKRIDPRVKLSKPVNPSLRYQNQMVQHKSETNGSSLMRQIPPRETPADLFQVNSQRNFYSSQATDGFRARSPPRNFDELHPPPSFRAVEASRAGQFLRNGMVGASQPTDSFVFNTPQAPRPVAQFAQTSGSMQKISQMGDETLSVAGLLHRLGLGKYAILFQAEEVDMTALKQMGDKDLKELGIPMGPRKKILLALLPRTKRQPP